MRIRLPLAALLLTTGLAHAQAVSPLGGSTNNAGSPPPALAKPTTGTPAPAATTTPAATPAPSTTPAPATAASPTGTAATPTHTRRTFDERFADANTTHDGKLTLEQARAGHMRSIVRDFAQIDKSKKGYVTLDEIKAHRSEVRAAHKAAKAKKAAE